MRIRSCMLFAMTASAVVAADDFKPEPGFTLVFNGKYLDGWQTKAAKPEKVDGKTDAYDKRFVVKDGEMVIDPAVKGDRYIETTKEFGKDVTIRFEFKPDEKCNNDLFLLGTKFDIKKEDVKNLKPGEWNDFEIVVKDGKAEFKCNGQQVKTLATKGDKSPFAVRAEFGSIVIRKLRASDGK